MSHCKPRILFVQVELHTWQRTRHWPYCCHIGLEEGFAANGVDFFTVTTPWIGRIRELCAGRQFDQLWLNCLLHTEDHDGGLIDEDTWAWLADVAPIRVGLTIESIEYSPTEMAAAPWFLNRKSIVQRRVPYLTHMAVVDEHDAQWIGEQFGVPTMWSPFAMPQRYIQQSVAAPTLPKAAFSGSLYGERGAWLQEAKAKNLLTYQQSPDQWALHRPLFGLLPKHRVSDLISRRLLHSAIPDAYLNPTLLYPTYLHLLRWIRQRGFAQWLHSLQAGPVVVDLPHLIKAYPTRLVEGMAIGRPVLAWEVPERPRNRALFEEGKEILLYATPTQLAEQLAKVVGDPTFGRAIADQARAKLSAFHTVEKRVAQMLAWIESGLAPTYGDQ